MFGRCRLVGLGLGLRAVQRTQLGVDVEQPVLAREQRGIVGIGDLGETPLLGEQLAQLTGRQVVAEQVVTERRVHAIAGLARGIDTDPQAREIETIRIVVGRARNPGGLADGRSARRARLARSP